MLRLPRRMRAKQVFLSAVRPLRCVGC
jgi:hypothetical protein